MLINQDGTPNDDQIVATGVGVTVSGLVGHDTLLSSGSGNTLNGGPDNDDLTGDRDDSLFGDEGNDRLFAGESNNTLTGGTGADEFFIAVASIPVGRHDVTDFDPDQDVIRFILDGADIDGIEFVHEGNDTEIVLTGDGDLAGTVVAVIRNTQPSDFNADNFQASLDNNPVPLIFPDDGGNSSGTNSETDGGGADAGTDSDDTDGDGGVGGSDGDDPAVALIDQDGDGVPDQDESPAGDRNGDGIPDFQQGNVASVPTLNAISNDPNDYFTLVADEDLNLREVAVITNPAPNAADAPKAIDFSQGFLNFDLEGLEPEEKAVVNLILPAGFEGNTYWIYDDTSQQWQNFLFDGQTGAEFFDLDDDGNPDRLRLHFIDGERGDKDGLVNGRIVDPGAPGDAPGVISLAAEANQVITLIGDELAIANQPLGNLQFRFDGNDTGSASEVGVFRIDAQNQVNGIAPGQSGYTAAALSEATVLFNGLTPENGFGNLDLFRNLQLTAGDRFGFYLIENGTRDGVLAGNNPDNLFFSIAAANSSGFSPLRISSSGNGLSFGFETDGDGDFNDFRFQAFLQDDFQGVQDFVANLQGNNENELLDLRDFNSNQLIEVTFSLFREAAFDNVVGFYTVNGTDGNIDGLLPGQAGYTEAALARRVADIALRAENLSSATLSTTLEGGELYAPFIVVDGTFTDLSSEIYFPFISANADGVDHVRSLGTNVIGFEDLPNGGDGDFDDIVVQIDIGAIA